jgi:hypothetical protein
MQKTFRQIRFAGGMVLFCALLVSSRQVFAYSYHSFTYGYAVSVPDDWVQIPDDILAVRSPDLPIVRTLRGTIDVAFQPKRNAKSLDYPYIIIEVVPYSGIGYAQQVTEDEIRSIVKLSTGLDPANPYSPENQIMEGGAELESLDGVINLEHDTHRYMWSSTSNVSDVGLVRSRQWGFFGRDAVVKVTLYERGRGSDRLRDMTRAVVGSFKFGIGREYQPSFTISDGLQMIKDLFAAPTLGMAVTLVCVGVSVIFALIAIFTSRSRLPSYGDARVDQDLASFMPPDRYEL